jgi:hypothetical protein
MVPRAGSHEIKARRFHPRLLKQRTGVGATIPADLALDGMHTLAFHIYESASLHCEGRCNAPDPLRLLNLCAIAFRQSRSRPQSPARVMRKGNPPI